MTISAEVVLWLPELARATFYSPTGIARLFLDRYRRATASALRHKQSRQLTSEQGRKWQLAEAAVRIP